MLLRGIGAALIFSHSSIAANASECDGAVLSGIPGAPKAWKLSTGGVAAFAKMNVNIDGYGRAYHPANGTAGALVHLCNAGRVFLADGTEYEGSESNATCTGRFMADVARIGKAGWDNPSVGAVKWYGILGTGSATIHGVKVPGVKPVLQKDGSGFYVSPTSLFDLAIPDPAEQSRYVNPLRIASGVMPKALGAEGIKMGSFGVAINVNKRVAVPFIVGDGGPRIGEGSVALVRLAAGAQLTDEITRASRYFGQVEERDVLWVFFGDSPVAYDSRNEAAVIAASKSAFERWGGEARLAKCVATVPRK
jgi:hypothetical protein